MACFPLPLGLWPTAVNDVGLALLLISKFGCLADQIRTFAALSGILSAMDDFLVEEPITTLTRNKPCVDVEWYLSRLEMK